jgi:hypothetical protein
VLKKLKSLSENMSFGYFLSVVYLLTGITIILFRFSFFYEVDDLINERVKINDGFNKIEQSLSNLIKSQENRADYRVFRKLQIPSRKLFPTSGILNPTRLNWLNWKKN